MSAKRISNGKSAKIMEGCRALVNALGDQSRKAVDKDLFDAHVPLIPTHLQSSRDFRP